MSPDRALPVNGSPLTPYQRFRHFLRRLHQIDPRQPLERLLEEVAHVVRDETGGDAASLVVRRDDRGTEVSVVAPQPPQEPVRQDRTWIETLPPLGPVDTSPLLLSVGDSGYPPLLPLYARAGVRLGTTLSAPLLRRGLRFGFLEILRPRNEEWGTLEGLELFTSLTDEIGVLLDNALLLDRLRRERLENELLYSVGRKIGLALDTDELMNSIIDSLGLVVPYDAAGVFLIDTRTLEVAAETIRGYRPEMLDRLRLKTGEGIVGWAAKTGQASIVPDVGMDPRYVAARATTRAEMAAPILSGGQVVGVFNLESDRVNAYTPHELRLLETFASQAAVAIERARYFRQQLERERLDRELSIARRIQISFLPASDPGWPGFDVSGYNISSEEVSGDFFDYIPITGPNWGIVVADVSGKGVPASLIMASLRAALWAEVRNTYSLSEICARINVFLYGSLGETEFVTAVYGVLNVEEGVFTYSNAGHLPPIHLHRDGRVAYLEEGGLILGAFPNAEYREGRTDLEPGDILLFYTDGAVEALNAADEEFGRERLVEALRRHRDLPAPALRAELVNEVQAFTGRNRLNDDLTFIVLKRLAPGAEQGK